MATYNITFRNSGDNLTIAPGQINTDTSLSLIGQGVTNYGEPIAQNFAKLLENFASNEPANPVEGQLWYDAAKTVLKIWDKNIADWRRITLSAPTGAVSSGTDPSITNSNQPKGTLQWFEDRDQLYASEGPNEPWVLVGPTNVEGSETGFINHQLDNGNWVVIEVVGGVLVGVWARDPIPNPNTNSPIPASQTYRIGSDTVTLDLRGEFPDGLNPGLNIPSPNAWIQSSIGSQDGSNRIEINNTEGRFVGDWIFGPTGSFTFEGPVDLGNNALSNLPDPTNGDEVGDRDFNDNRYMQRDGDAMDGDLTTENIIPKTNASFDIGTSGNRFDTVYANTFDGTATQAQYADLAERYYSGQTLEHGTVVRISQMYEIEPTDKSMDIEVFGVVSTNPGLMLNSVAGNDEEYPYIALTGRVPVKVKGTVTKGQRLVSSDTPGVAEAIDLEDELTKGNFKAYAASFGRALENKDNTGIDVIEVVVGNI